MLKSREQLQAYIDLLEREHEALEDEVAALTSARDAAVESLTNATKAARLNQAASFLFDIGPDDLDAIHKELSGHVDMKGMPKFVFEIVVPVVLDYLRKKATA